MSWRDEREKAIRSQPPEPAAAKKTVEHGQTDDDNRQNNFKASSGPFDPASCTREVDTLMAEIVKHDPHGGCWEWVKKNLADKWRHLMTVMNDIDKAFQEKHGSNLLQAIADTRRLYHKCVAAWLAVSTRKSSNE